MSESMAFACINTFEVRNLHCVNSNSSRFIKHYQVCLSNTHFFNSLSNCVMSKLNSSPNLFRPLISYLIVRTTNSLHYIP